MRVEVGRETGPQRLGQGTLLRVWLGLAIGMAAGLGASLCLPFDRYIAWQQAAGTQMFHARWIYERLHFDRTPIEVALIGSSRLESGISPRVLAAALSRRLGRTVAVANLSIVMPGRDFTDSIVAELLATHPEVRLIILSDDGEVTNSHPMFKETARAGDLWRAPFLINLHYGSNLLALPYRNIANAVQQWHPAWFGVTGRFRPSDYLGTGLDRTLGYRTPAGKAVNGDRRMAPAELLRMSRAAVARQRAGLALLRPLPVDQRLAIDRHYLASIAQRARRGHVRLAFLSLPLYGPLQEVGDVAAYERLGPVIALDGLSRHADYYQSAAHLNRQGASIASLLVAEAIAPLLGTSPHEGRKQEGAS